VVRVARRCPGERVPVGAGQGREAPPDRPAVAHGGPDGPGNGAGPGTGRVRRGTQKRRQAARRCGQAAERQRHRSTCRRATSGTPRAVMGDGPMTERRAAVDFMPHTLTLVLSGPQSPALTSMPGPARSVPCPDGPQRPPHAHHMERAGSSSRRGTGPLPETYLTPAESGAGREAGREAGFGSGVGGGTRLTRAWWTPRRRRGPRGGPPAWRSGRSRPWPCRRG
jgi:hypothetical protein